METDVTNAPVGLAFVSIGLSRSMFGPFLLPLPLDGFGFPGCSAYHDMALDSGQLCSPSGGALRHSIFIPNIPALMNLPIYFQAMAVAPGANAGGVIVSNALELVLGST